MEIILLGINEQSIIWPIAVKRGNSSHTLLFSALSITIKSFNTTVRFLLTLSITHTATHTCQSPIQFIADGGEK